MASTLIRVGIVDDHPVVGEGTAAILRAQPDLEIVGVADSLDTARAAGLTNADRVDVLLLDIRLGADSGLGLLSGGIEERAGRPAVVVLTAYDYPQYADAALRMGAAGFVLKTAPLTELLDAIRRVAAGGLVFDRRPGEVVALTPRERSVMVLLVEGDSNDQIATALGITTRTVEAHLARLFERVGVASRTELATRAIREGLLDVPATRVDTG